MEQNTQHELFKKPPFNLFGDEMDDPETKLKAEVDRREGRIIASKQQMVLLPEPNPHDD